MGGRHERRRKIQTLADCHERVLGRVELSFGTRQPNKTAINTITSDLYCGYVCLLSIKYINKCRREGEFLHFLFAFFLTSLDRMTNLSGDGPTYSDGLPTQEVSTTNTIRATTFLAASGSPQLCSDSCSVNCQLSTVNTPDGNRGYFKMLPPSKQASHSSCIPTCHPSSLSPPKYG